MLEACHRCADGIGLSCGSEECCQHKRFWKRRKARFERDFERAALKQRARASGSANEKDAPCLGGGPASGEKDTSGQYSGDGRSPAPGLGGRLVLRLLVFHEGSGYRRGRCRNACLSGFRLGFGFLFPNAAYR